MLTTFKDTRKCIRADFQKINGKFTLKKFIKSLLFEPGFKYIFWMRLTQYFWVKKGIRFPLFLLSRFVLKHYSYKYNYDISYKAKIGEGFSISHHGYVIIRVGTTIGKNCWVRPGTCIGKKHLDERGDGAVIGDNCNIGVGVAIMGKVVIGDNVTIGANSVVLKDVPSDCVVAGAPARIVKNIFISQ